MPKEIDDFYHISRLIIHVFQGKKRKKNIHYKMMKKWCIISRNLKKNMVVWGIIVAKGAADCRPTRRGLLSAADGICSFFDHFFSNGFCSFFGHNNLKRNFPRDLWFFWFFLYIFHFFRFFVFSNDQSEK